MPTRLIQSERHAAGAAAFQVSGPAQAQLPIPETVEISIVQGGGVDRYLDPRNPDDPWKTAVYRFAPVAARRDGNELSIDIDHGVTYHLRPNQPYRLLIRQVEGLEIEERFTGPSALRRVVTKPTGWVPPPGPQGPLSTAADVAPAVATVVQTPSEIVDAPVEPPVAIEEPKPEPMRIVDPPPVVVNGRKSPMRWIVAGVLTLIVALAAGYFYLQKSKEPAAATAVTPDKHSLDSLAAVRDYLAANPTMADALTEAKGLEAKHALLDGQFLLFKYAAEHGSTDAARQMGSFYDPSTWTAQTSPMPAANPVEAARWYQIAAEAGDADAQYRYAMLLKTGGTDAPDGPEQAQVWLRKAADQGNADAKKALGN